MKKYISSATKWLAIIVLIGAVIMTIGIILILVGFPDDSLQFGLTVSGGLICILFLSCYFAERSRTLMIDENKIIFPRGVNKNGEIILKRTLSS